jgi:hypothetical protein
LMVRSVRSRQLSHKTEETSKDLMFYGEQLAVWNEGNSWFVLDLAASTRDSDA